MNMKRNIRLPIAGMCAALCCVTALTGCLRFENSMDLSKPINATTSAPGGESVTAAPATDPYASLPSGESTTAQGEPALSDTPGGEDVTATPDASTDAAETTGSSEGEADTAQGQTAAPTETPVPSTQAPVNTDESTTANGGEVTTAAAPASAAEAAKSLGDTEYDVLRSDSLTIDAVLGDETGEKTPTTMSIGEGKLYMVSEMDGMQMGIYIEGKKTYIYLPAHKKYLKLNAAVAKLADINPDEFSEMAAEMGFESLPALSEAKSVAEGTMNGVACKLFTLTAEDGSTMVVGLNGKKLVGIEYPDGTGKLTSFIYFNSVTSGFPAMPPQGYEEMGYIEFVKLLMDEMETQG